MGLRWRISCGGTKDFQIGEGPRLNNTLLVWTDFAFSFTVPEKDCPLQHVRLASEARSASEQFITGSIWFDDLEIVRHSVALPQLARPEKPVTRSMGLKSSE